MARNFLLLNYHAFAAFQWLISVTFSTPTGYNSRENSTF
jgi:hypothetical protein